ncbi:DUF370 domain-containing protein [Cytobacillus spongiae]|jgi:hypothetical protein|uniref:extracellular matrix regulator RemB n=1 Tax=Cytobacillus spongiae TaxID=2901381 RepID=UPI001F1B6E87|nr:extracellular matrix/biofilm biosynthesis regulator RemA family protein [Cytobacillus spongiae]UII55969.1 DUF370 domain-containing protein [Cytobacillus spongiae]
MYVHVGEDTLVRSRDIIVILDKESVSQAEHVQEFLERQSTLVEDLSKGSYKSIVVTCDKIYFSPLASGTLKKRSQGLSVHEF